MEVEHGQPLRGKELPHPGLEPGELRLVEHRAATGRKASINLARGAAYMSLGTVGCPDRGGPGIIAVALPGHADLGNGLLTGQDAPSAVLDKLLLVAGLPVAGLVAARQQRRGAGQD